MSDEQWQQWIKRMLGKPFKLGARGPDAYDCWGVVEQMFLALNKPSPGEWWIEESTSMSNYMDMIADEIDGGPWKLVSAPEPGDVLALSVHQRIHHVAAMTPYGALHADKPLGAVLMSIDRLRQMGYQKIEAYRWEK